MATIYVDNKPYEVKDGQNLLQACLNLGFNLPYFCWHPAMHSVGACRQCAIKQFRDEADTRGRIVMACMTPASNNTRISIEDPEVRAFRAANIEWLMLNHPHDCPVCDEGGECHLQDMTVMTGHVYRRTRFPKRSFRNQYLGPFVHHELNRCIQCYRCVRYYRDFAGGDDLDVFGVHDRLYFGRAEDGVLESEFAGNLVEVCPTGVFTDETRYHHYTRKWDFNQAPSICVHCSLGCNTLPGERYGMLRQIRNRYNGEVNGYFLCDRGRYGYEFVNSAKRIREPMAKMDGAPTAVTAGDAVDRAVEILRSGRAIGIGSPRASLEANYALQSLVGADAFYAGLSERERPLVYLSLDILRKGPVRTPSLREIERMDAVLILGEDPTNYSPMLDLALKQLAKRQPMKQLTPKARVPEWDDAAVRELIQDRRGPFYVATPAATKLDGIATQTYRAGPADIARLGQAVARALGVPGDPIPGLSDDVSKLADEIATALKSADRPLIVAGTGLGSAETIRAAADVANALVAAGKPAGLFLTQAEPNSLGVAMLGGGSLEAAFDAVREGRADTVVVLENDLYRRAPADKVDGLFAAAKRVIAIDHLLNPTTERADLCLPGATYAESDGTLVNNEGRAQRFLQVFVPSGGAIQESWRWLHDVAVAAMKLPTGSWLNLDMVIASMVQAHPQLAAVAQVTPPADFRIAGQRIARESRRYTGRTAMLANVTVHEPKPPSDPDTPLSFSMEGFHGQPPSPLITQFWSPGWNSIQSLNKFQEEIAGPLRGGDPGRRLLDPPAAGEAAPRFFAEATPAEKAPSGQLLAVPLYHIYGSEELSMLTPGVAELAPAPYLGLSPADAERLGLAPDARLSVGLGSQPRDLAIRIIPSLAAGLVGVPVGLPGITGVELPTYIDLREAVSGRGA